MFPVPRGRPTIHGFSRSRARNGWPTTANKKENWFQKEKELGRQEKSWNRRRPRTSFPFQPCCETTNIILEEPFVRSSHHSFSRFSDDFWILVEVSRWIFLAGAPWNKSRLQLQRDIVWTNQQQKEKGKENGWSNKRNLHQTKLITLWKKIAFVWWFLFQWHSLGTEPWSFFSYKYWFPKNGFSWPANILTLHLSLAGHGNIGSQTVSPSQYSFWSQLLACDSKIQTHNRMLTPEHNEKWNGLGPAK